MTKLRSSTVSPSYSTKVRDYLKQGLPWKATRKKKKKKNLKKKTWEITKKIKNRNIK